MGEMEAEVPDQFRCPISLHLMKDPVILSTGITYDRRSIETWLSVYSSSRSNIKCPVTNKMLSDHDELIPNHLLRRCIQDWCLQQASRASESVDRMSDSGQAVDAFIAEVNSCKTGQKFKEAMQKLTVASGKECYRDGESSISSTKLPASILCSHSKWATQLRESVQVFEETLGALVMISPVHEETCRLISSSSEALLCLTRILVEGSREGKENAVLFLEQLVAADSLSREKLRATERMAEGLLHLLRNDELLSRTLAKSATITTIFHIAADETVREKLIEVGAIAILMEIFPRADRNICETGLGALDNLCNCAHGRSAAYDQDSTVPIVSQKILGVSELATEFAVSILWTLCRHSDSPSVALEAIQEGAIEKLLVLMQIGCGQKTRKRTSQLLGLFNHYGNGRSREWEWRRKTINFGQVIRSSTFSG